MAASKYFTKQAARLSRAAPREWAEFFGAFRDHTEARMLELTQSPSAGVHTAQGRAQEAYMILRALENCQKDADDMEKTNARTR